MKEAQINEIRSHNRDFVEAGATIFVLHIGSVSFTAA